MIITGEIVDVYGVFTKGQELAGHERWVTSFFISSSLDGFRYNAFKEGGQRKVRSVNLEDKAHNLKLNPESIAH